MKRRHCERGSGLRKHLSGLICSIEDSDDQGAAIATEGKPGILVVARGRDAYGNQFVADEIVSLLDVIS
jgi:hypothetical protein